MPQTPPTRGHSRACALRKRESTFLVRPTSRLVMSHISAMIVLAMIVGTFQLGAAQTAIPGPSVSRNLAPKLNEDKASTSANQTPDPALAQAKSLLQQGNVDEAERAVRRYLDAHANSAEAHFLLGHIYFQQVHQEAVSASAQKEQPGYSNPSAADPEFTAAKAKASLAEFTEGAKYHDPSAFDLKVVALDYVLLRDYPDADKWLTKSLQWDPGDSEGWYYLGRAKYNENRFQEAIDAFQECLKLDPKNVKAEDNLGLSYQGLGRTDDATAAYHTALAWQEHSLNQDSGPFINLGALLLDENQPQEAVPYLLQAIAISPRELRGHEHLGTAYEHLGQLAKAQTEYEKAVELAPQNARLHYLLAQVYRKEGLTEKAKLEFDRSAALRASRSSTEEPK